MTLHYKQCQNKWEGGGGGSLNYGTYLVLYNTCVLSHITEGPKTKLLWNFFVIIESVLPLLLGIPLLVYMWQITAR